MKNKIISCLNCKERCVGCHSTCEKYLKEKSARDEKIEMINKQKELEEIFISFKAKKAKEAKKKNHLRS